ncbi:hypothetical protein [Herbaspirillum seropedicae]|uniref:hypothetical protein n=1 Tax=Herbaspirillum seropedicae TaxID=964 RepID=UPI003D95FBC9
MLTLTDAQYQTFLACDTQNFVVAVADQFLNKRREMLAEPGRTEIIARMRAAYDNGINLGFTSAGHLIYLMYMSADYPGIFERPMAQRYLLKPGAAPEQRLDEIKAILSHVTTTAQQREEESQR